MKSQPLTASNEAPALPRWMEEYRAAIGWPADFSIGSPLAIEGPHRGVLSFNADQLAELRLSDKETACHIALIAKSGGGKSRLAQGLVQSLFLAGHGGTVFDNRGMLPHDIVAWLAKQYHTTGDPQFLERVHVFDPTPQRVHSEQPLRCPESYRAGGAFEWWRQTQVDDYLETLLRAVTPEQREIMKRLYRHAGNFFRLIATPDDEGRQLSPAEVLILMNVYDPDHDRLFARFQHRLPRRDRNDFEHLHRLRATKRDQVIDGMLESTQNMVARSVDVVMEAIYSRPDVPSVPYEEIITRGHWMIFVGRPNDLRSQRSMANVTDLAFRQIRLTASKLTAEGRQRLHYVILDEPGNSSLAGPDLDSSYELCRATKVSLVTLWQDRSTFQIGDLDLFYPVINNSDLVICGQQKLPDAELVRYLRLPNSQLAERVQEVDRPDPGRDEVVTMINGGESISGGISQSHSVGLSAAIGSSTGSGVSIVRNESTARSRTQLRTTATGEQSNWSSSSGSGDASSLGQSSGVASSINTISFDGELLHIPSASDSQGDFFSSGNSHFESEGQGGGQSRSVAQSVGESTSQAYGKAIGRALNRLASASLGASRTQSESINWMKGWSQGWSQTLVQRTRVDVQHTGRPRYDLDFQDGIVEFLLSVIPPRCAFCRGRINGREQTVLFRTADVPDPFDDPGERQYAVEEYLTQLYGTKNYLFTPEPTEVARARRLKVFQNTPAAPAEDNPDNDRFNFS